MALAEAIPLDVIAVGAHPDDVEIGCGGTLARLAAQGHKVGIVDLTDGEPTPLSPGPAARLAEASEAARTLGAAHRVTLELPNRRLFDTFEARVALSVLFRRHRPRLVLGLGDKTPLASPDHWQAVQIIDAAVFYARLTKWDDQFEHTPPHRIDAQLYYSLSTQHAAPPPEGWPVAVDISGHFEQKIAAIRCYKSQFPPEKQQLFERIEAHARYLGQAAGCEAAELLISPRPLATADLMGFILGERGTAGPA